VLVLALFLIQLLYILLLLLGRIAALALEINFTFTHMIGKGQVKVQIDQTMDGCFLTCQLMGESTTSVYSHHTLAR